MKKDLKQLTIILIITISTLPYLQAQEHEHDHEEHHKHYKNELGIANVLVLFPDEDELAYGLHLHYVRNIKETNLGFGLAYIKVFDEHKHNTVGVISHYHFDKGLSFVLSPGISFEGTEFSEHKFSIHSEVAYNFVIKGFDIGPMLEFAVASKHIHYGLGLHVGIGF